MELSGLLLRVVLGFLCEVAGRFGKTEGGSWVATAGAGSLTGLFFGLDGSLRLAGLAESEFDEASFMEADFKADFD